MFIGDGIFCSIVSEFPAEINLLFILLNYIFFEQTVSEVKSSNFVGFRCFEFRMTKNNVLLLFSGTRKTEHV